jgi:hypothetical protein
MNRVPKIIISVLAGLMLLTGSFIAGRLSAIKPTTKPVVSSENGKAVVIPEEAQLPLNVFDTELSIKDTSIKFSYPKAGFFGLGAVIDHEEPWHSPVGTDPIPPVNMVEVDTAASHYSRGVPLISLTVSGQALDSKKNLRDIIAGSTDGEKREGVYAVINSHEFHIYRLPYAGTMASWSAVSVGKKEAVNVLLTTIPGDNSVSYTTYENSDLLFFQILSHLKFD